ncbi:MAG TPA: hypothetical protein VME66_06120 [Candidatus Acidoferrales bacterium]|nr:hypothetical protein [Candidatus Acidoferrales bacterium]
MVITNRLKPFACFLVAASALAACGGGTGTTTPPTASPAPGVSAKATTVPTSPPTPAQSGAPTTGTAQFTIADPLETPAGISFAGSRRRPQYFSPGTDAIEIVINGTSNLQMLSSTSPNCTTTSGTINCVIDIPEPDGPITYTARTLIQTYDGSFETLSQASGTATISGTTTIPLALQGVWQTAVATLASPNPLMGAPATLTVNVSAYDAAGALIVGPEPYSSPIPLFDSDTSGATSLSATSVTGPSQTVTLAYDGTSYVNAVVSAVSPAPPAPETTGTFGPSILVPAVRATEYQIPSGTAVVYPEAGAKTIYVNADDSLEFLESAAIGHAAPTGTITETAIPAQAFQLVEGPNATPWFLTAQNDVSQVSLAELNAGTVTSFPLTSAPAASFLIGPIVFGSDGNFWLPYNVPAPEGSQAQTLFRVQPSGVQTGYVVDNEDLCYSVAGSDGNLWFIGQSAIVKVTTSGAATTYPFPSSFTCCNSNGAALAFGPDGALYIVTTVEPTIQVERMTTAGVFSTVATLPFFAGNFNGDAAFGPDNALWIPLSSGPEVGCNSIIARVTTTGATSFALLPTCQPGNTQPTVPEAIAGGTNDDLWYTRGNIVGRITL